MIDRFVTRNGIRLHVVDHGGHGRPVVFLHGGTAHAHWWDFVILALGPSIRRVAVDLRGHGDSEWASDGAYAIGDYVGDLAAILTDLDLEPAVLVGHSLGSFVALHHALERPQATAGVVVVDGRASFGATGTRYLRLLGMFGTAEYASLDEAIERFRPMPKETIARPEVLAHVTRRGMREQDGVWIAKFDRASLNGLDSFDLRPRLGEIACPVLFVRGEHSTVLSKDAAEKLARACRNGRTVELARCHHHVLIDRPDVLAAEIRSFLLQLPP